jgi:hypothetical protein
MFKPRPTNGGIIAHKAYLMMSVDGDIRTIERDDECGERVSAEKKTTTIRCVAKIFMVLCDRMRSWQRLGKHNQKKVQTKTISNRGIRRSTKITFQVESLYAK